MIFRSTRLLRPTRRARANTVQTQDITDGDWVPTAVNVMSNDFGLVHLRGASRISLCEACPVTSEDLEIKDGAWYYKL